MLKANQLFDRFSQASFSYACLSSPGCQALREGTPGVSATANTQIFELSKSVLTKYVDLSIPVRASESPLHKGLWRDHMSPCSRWCRLAAAVIVIVSLPCPTREKARLRPYVVAQFLFTIWGESEPTSLSKEDFLHRASFWVLLHRAGELSLGLVPKIGLLSIKESRNTWFLNSNPSSATH